MKMLIEKSLLAERVASFSPQKGVKVPIRKENLTEHTSKIFRVPIHFYVRIGVLC